MNRRKFIRDTSLLSLAALGGLAAASAPIKPDYKMGYQLYSIRDEMGVRPVETLKALRGMGYRDFEVYGFDAVSNSIYGFNPAEFQSILDGMGLSTTSGHYGFNVFLNKSDEELLRFTDACIAAASAMKSPYITWPWMAPEQRTIENFKLLADRLNVIGARVSQAGLGFAYHNHGFEFEDHDGENGYDIILRQTDAGLVKLQMDMYWVMHAGKTTPKELVRQHPGRYVMWHVKDMDTVTRDYTELGHGAINYSNVLPDAATSGLEYLYIEQGGNFKENSLESAAYSARYFRKKLRKML